MDARWSPSNINRSLARLDHEVEQEGRGPDAHIVVGHFDGLAAEPDALGRLHRLLHCQQRTFGQADLEQGELERLLDLGQLERLTGHHPCLVAAGAAVGFQGRFRGVAQGGQVVAAEGPLLGGEGVHADILALLV